VGGNQNFEEGRGGGAGQVGFEGIERLLIEPALHEPNKVGAAEDADDAIPQRPWTLFDCHVHDSWKEVSSRERGDVERAPTLPSPASGGGESWSGDHLYAGFLDDGEGLVETKHLGGVGIAFRQFGRTITA
jgi:hypothetical protein